MRGGVKKHNINSIGLFVVSYHVNNKNLLIFHLSNAIVLMIVSIYRSAGLSITASACTKGATVNLMRERCSPSCPLEQIMGKNGRFFFTSFRHITAVANCAAECKHRKFTISNKWRPFWHSQILAWYWGLSQISSHERFRDCFSSTFLWNWRGSSIAEIYSDLLEKRSGVSSQSPNYKKYNLSFTSLSAETAAVRFTASQL